MSTNEVVDEPSYRHAWMMLILSLAIGGGAGFALKVSTDTSGYRGATLTNYTIVDSQHGAFNWYLFLLFAATGLVCFAVCMAAAAITARMPGPGTIQ
ncbi:MAG: hypothetical protein Q7V57_11050 [Actinomycetota bacterium]|nr:hypothetical protein [Actinomycetota bacterium]